MKIHRYITASLVLFGFLLGIAPTYTYAAPSDGDSRTSSATLLCGGAHKVEEDGTVTRTSSWSFRNYNDSASITIDHIRIYDGNGDLIHEEMPNEIVVPNSTAIFSSKVVEAVGRVNPLQFILDWSSVSGKKVLTLDGYVVRWNGLPDGTPVGIFTFNCRTI